MSLRCGQRGDGVLKAAGEAKRDRARGKRGRASLLSRRRLPKLESGRGRVHVLRVCLYECVCNLGTDSGHVPNTKTSEAGRAGCENVCICVRKNAMCACIPGMRASSFSTVTGRRGN